MTDGQREPDRAGGLPIRTARKKYVPRELWVRYLAALGDCPPPYDEDLFEIKYHNELYLETPRYAAFLALEKVRVAVWGDLVAKLESGYLVGFVFDAFPINLDSRRRRVSSNLWSRALKIGGDIVIGGIKYSDARIWRAADLEQPGGEPDAVGGRGEVSVQRAKNWKVLVPIVAAETPAAAALLDDPNPPHGAVKAAVEAMMQDARLVGAVAESVERELQKIRPPRSKKKANS